MTHAGEMEFRPKDEPSRAELLAKVERLTDELKRVRSAVRMSETAREQINAHERKVLTSLAGKEMASILETLAAVREECAAWNARATEMEAERDAERSRCHGLCLAEAEDLHHSTSGYQVAMSLAEQIESGVTK